MKIVAGLGSIDDYIRLVKAGADEFFCGYVPQRWLEQYGVLSPLNRREVLNYNVQIGAREDLCILKRMVDEYQVPVKITFNSLSYLPSQYALIADLIKECMELGFDTFILADPALILYLRNHGIQCKIHLSGEIAEVNRKMMEVFNEWKITRYIFHRKNTIEDMASCIQANQGECKEYEAFALNEMCHFTGGFCNSLHCDELAHLCMVPYEMAGVEKDIRHSALYERIIEEEERIWNFIRVQEEKQEIDQEDMEQENDNCESASYLAGGTGCGLCALQQLYQAGVTHLKLVGRGNYIDSMERDIKNLRLAIDLAEQGLEETVYQERMKQAIFGRTPCSGQCYYRKAESIF